MQVEHKTEKGTVRFELIPEQVINVDLIYTPKGLELRGVTKDRGWWYSDEIPIGFVKIGLTSEVTEEQAKVMVLGRIDQTSFPTSMEYYNYCSEKMVHLSFDFEYALESFKSLLKANKILETNPYGTKQPFIDNDHTNIELRSGWDEAQSKTEKWIVLFKPND